MSKHNNSTYFNSCMAHNNFFFNFVKNDCLAFIKDVRAIHLHSAKVVLTSVVSNAIDTNYNQVFAGMLFL